MKRTPSRRKSSRRTRRAQGAPVELLARFGESAGAPSLLVLDAEGKLAWANPAAQALFGLESDGSLGRPFGALLAADDAHARADAQLRTALEQGRAEYEGWALGGKRFWGQLEITAIFGPRQKLEGYAVLARDQSERRAEADALRRSEQRFRTLVDGVHDYAIFMVDPTGRVESWNDGARRIKGYQASEILGQNIDRFYTDEDRQAGQPQKLLATAAREGRVEFEGWRVRKDGTRFWAGVLITALHGDHGELVGFAKITRDMTERRRAEEERLRLAQANEAIRLRDDFLSIASHELKTPLTALQLQLEGLRTRMDALEPRMAAKIDRATRSTLRLADLVENLLDVSRIASGRFTLAPEAFDASALAAEVIERVQDAAAQAGCTVTLEADPAIAVRWDRLRIEQVLMNLLSNAFKYAAGTTVQVALHRLGNEARLIVADRGPGVPADAVERIFGRFERAASTRNFGGLGLGLYVTREIVEAHRGAIAVERVEPHGARFVVSLPLRVGSEQTEHAP